MNRDFEPVCTARSVEEAELIAAWFVRQGVRAHVKDRNMVSMLTWGTPAIAPRGIEVVVPPEESEHARTLWSERADDVLAEEEAVDDGQPIEAECESCGTMTLFPAKSTGRVEDCPNCGDYVDVPET